MGQRSAVVSHDEGLENDTLRKDATAWDVAIAGAGPAGVATAMRLAQNGHQVLLCDPRLEVVLKPADTAIQRHRTGDALPGNARWVLERLDLWRHLLPADSSGRAELQGHDRCYGNISIWGNEEPACHDFLDEPTGLGWHLNRSLFDRQLQKAALGCKGVTGADSRLQSPHWREGEWLFDLPGHGSQRARWLVDATGRAAALASRLGAWRRRDDDLTAVCAWVPTGPDDQDQRNLIEATPFGWWYSALLPISAGWPRLRTVMLHTGAACARKIQEEPELWPRLLQMSRHLGVLAASTPSGRLRLAEATGAALSLPTGRTQNRSWLATGDAALSFDPVSSQGIFNSLYTGMLAGDTISAGLNNDPTAVARYETELSKIRRTYQHRRWQCYAAVGRWALEPFWQQRQGISHESGFPAAKTLSEDPAKAIFSMAGTMG